MKKIFTKFFALIGLMLIGGGNSAWAEVVTVGLTATKDVANKTIAAPSFTGSGEAITISDAIQRGSEINAIAAKPVYIADTEYAAAQTWRKSVSSNDDNKFVESANQWVGYELNVSQSNQFSIKSAHVHIMVSDKINLYWKVKILDGDDNVLYTSLEKKSTRATDTDFTVDFTGAGLETTLAALSNLNGKIKVRVYVSQNGGTKYFTADAITLTGDLIAVSQTKYQKPTITIGAYDQPTGKYAVTLTANDDDAVVNYTVGSDDKVSGATSGTVINVAPNTTIVATASGSSYDESDEQSSTTAAAPKLAKPTNSLGAYDYAANTYPVTLGCEDGAHIWYRVNRGAWTSYSAPFNAGVNALIEAQAKQNNMTASDVLSFNVASAPAGGVSSTPASAGYTDGMSYNAGAFTIPSTNSYIGGQISSGTSSINGSIKMRISRNADPAGSQESKYGFHILVNPGNTITSVTLTILNNYNTNIALTGVYVDNSTDNALSKPYSISKAGKVDDVLTEATVIPVEGISATEKVVFVFEKEDGESNNPNQAQILISANYDLSVNLNMNLNASGYATFSCAAPVQISGAKAYKGAVEGEELVCTEIENGLVPAGEGVILVGEAGAEVTASYSVAPAVSDNALKATTKADGSLAALESCVVLSGDTFVPYSGDAFAANKAYLPYSIGGARLRMVFGGEANGINEVNVNATAPAKRIVNGKLVIEKAGKMFNAAGAQIK